MKGSERLLEGGVGHRESSTEPRKRTGIFGSLCFLCHSLQEAPSSTVKQRECCEGEPGLRKKSAVDSDSLCLRYVKPSKLAGQSCTGGFLWCRCLCSWGLCPKQTVAGRRPGPRVTETGGGSGDHLKPGLSLPSVCLRHLRGKHELRQRAKRLTSSAPPESDSKVTK